MAGGALLRAVQSDSNIHQRHILLLVTPSLSLPFKRPITNTPPPRAIFKYAQYFAKRHPKVIDDEKSVEVVVRISESQIFDSRPQSVLTQKSRPQSVMSRPQSLLMQQSKPQSENTAVYS